jgi:MoaA/NifB/PqqE/SkfB family radical SAM enzyme
MIVTKDFFEEFELDLTGTCNLSCPLCSRNYSHAQHMVFKNERPLSEIINQLDTFPNLERGFVAGQVSEPTLYTDFLDYIRYLKNRNITLEIFTNGSTRDIDFWSELSSILTEDDQVHFTICGSTQEIHEKYRIGSNLSKLLDNVKSFQSNKNNDFCQFIKFEYNKDDEVNVKQLPFSNHYTVDTEGVRNKNNKVKSVDKDIKPEITRDRTIKWLFNNQPTKNTCGYEIQCKSIEDKKIYITQEGKVSACYIHYEYNPEHTFNTDSFDYSSILSFDFQDCFLCEKKIKFKIDSFGLDFVC